MFPWTPEAPSEPGRRAGGGLVPGPGLLGPAPLHGQATSAGVLPTAPPGTALSTGLSGEARGPGSWGTPLQPWAPTAHPQRSHGRAPRSGLQPRLAAWGWGPRLLQSGGSVRAGRAAPGAKQGASRGQARGGRGQQPFAQPAMKKNKSGRSESDREGPHAAAPRPPRGWGGGGGGLRSEGPRRLPAWTRAWPSCPQLGGEGHAEDFTSLWTAGPPAHGEGTWSGPFRPSPGRPPAPAGQCV